MDSYFTSQDYSELHIFQDKKIDFFAAICLHTNGRGPAIGGCRFIPYASKNDAIQDAIRLSNAMSYKSAISELQHDGGKAVIMMPKHSYDRALFLKKFAECVNSLNGKYITTVDSGTSQADMTIIKSHTSYVIGYLTGTDADSNPSDSTALGVYTGIKAAVKLKLEKNSLEGLHVVIQGVGSVGYRLAKLLHADGVLLTVTDTDREHAKRVANEFQANYVAPDDIYSIACDVFSPCALGRVINQDTISQLKTKIIAGAANDQLVNEAMSEMLNQKGILYLPDYLLNAGGLIHLAMQMQGKNTFSIETEVRKIGDRIQRMTAMAKESGLSLFQVVQEATKNMILQPVL
jgi:leucine dehydrogenase